jgi:hypothetical protein
MGLLFGILICSLLLHIVFLQIEARNTIETNKFRLAFFALRDRLAMLVVKGKLQEDSWAYKHIVDALNFHIHAVETLSIVDLVEVVIRFHTSSNSENCGSELISFNELTPEAREILREYLRVVRKLILRNSKWQIRTIRVVNKVLGNGQKTTGLVSDPRPAIEQIDQREVGLQIA